MNPKTIKKNAILKQLQEEGHHIEKKGHLLRRESAAFVLYWQKAWCVLTETTLFIFPPLSNRRTKPLASIYIKGTTAINDLTFSWTITGKHNGFGIEDGPLEEVFEGSTAEGKTRWMKCLLRVVSSALLKTNNELIKKHCKESTSTIGALPPPPSSDIILNRVSDVKDEECLALSPILGLEEFAVLPFQQALEPLVPFVPNLQPFIQMSQMWAEDTSFEGLNLSVDMVAAINIYTREWSRREDSLYFKMNEALRNQDRTALKPFFPFLKLLLMAFERIGNYRTTPALWRGVRGNYCSPYQIGKRVIWWGCSSCTTSIDTVKAFLGDKGERTIFNIHHLCGVELSPFSVFEGEKEVLLPPGRVFEVLNCSEVSPNLYLIELKELPSNLVSFQMLESTPSAPSSHTPLTNSTSSKPHSLSTAPSQTPLQTSSSNSTTSPPTDSSPPHHPRDWTVDDLYNWLQSLKLPDIAETCKSERIDGDALLILLENKKWTDIGITQKGPQLKIEHHLQKLLTSHRQ